MRAVAPKLLDMDEASAMLDKDEQRDIAVEKKEAAKNMLDFEKFKASWTQKKAAVRSAGGTANSKPKKPKALAGVKKRALPTDSTIEQKDIRMYLPPGGHVWKSRGASSWCARLPPYSQVSRSWQKHGDHLALRLCIRHCWDQYLDDEGLTAEDCPITNLYLLTAAALSTELAGSGAASSSSATRTS